MGKGIERLTLPRPGEGFDPQDEAQFRRQLDSFMANADGRVREMDEDLDTVEADLDSVETDVADHESRIAALEGAAETGLVLIEAQEAASVSEITFTTDIDNTYDTYLLEVIDAVPELDGPRLRLETSSDGGSTWDGGGSDYKYVVEDRDSGGIEGSNQSTGADHIKLTPDTSEGSGTPTMGVSFTLRIGDPANTDKRTSFWWFGTYLDNSNNFSLLQGAGQRTAAEAVDAFRIRFGSAPVTMVSGKFRLYGIVKS